MEQLMDIYKMTDIDKKQLLKEYRKYVIKAFFHGKYDASYKDSLEFNKNSYLEEYELYKKYFDLLLKNKARKNNEAVIKMITYLNSRYQDTLDHYLMRGEYYCYLHPDISIDCYRNITRDQELADEVHGLALYNSDIERYFREGEAMFYLREHTHFFNGGDDTSFYGIYPFIENGILRRINIVVPRVHNLKTALINIHEYRIGIDLYDLIGEEYPENKDFDEIAKAEEENFLQHYIRNK